MKVIFFGTPAIAAEILEFLIEKKINIIAVVTKPDKKKGRDQKILPSPVKITAEKHHLPLYQPLKARDPEFINILRSFHADLFVVAAYSEIFNETLLKMPPLGCINVHASLLPKYRGAAPIERCIMAGEKESGITIMQMVKELDAGDLYAVFKTPITEDMTSGDLYNLLSKMGGKALYNVLLDIEKGTFSLTPQDHTQATYAQKVTPQESEINWNQPASQVHNFIRGLTPKPGAFCFIEIENAVKRLIIKKTRIVSHQKAEPGEIISSEKKFIVACREGALHLEKVQLEGKKILTDEEFLRGIFKKKFKIILKK